MTTRTITEIGEIFRHIRESVDRDQEDMFNVTMDPGAPRAWKRARMSFMNMLSNDDRRNVYRYRSFMILTPRNHQYIMVTISTFNLMYMIQHDDKHYHHIASLCTRAWDMPLFDNLAQISEMMRSREGEEIVLRNSNIVLETELGCTNKECVRQYHKFCGAVLRTKVKMPQKYGEMRLFAIKDKDIQFWRD